MLKLLRGKTDKPQPKHSDPLDIRRYTRIAPRETRTVNDAARPAVDVAPAQDCAIHAGVKHPRHSAIPKAPAAVVRPQRVQRKAEINLSEHLYSEAAISVSLLRRSLPGRFRDVDMRKQNALASFDSPLKYAVG